MDFQGPSGRAPPARACRRPQNHGRAAWHCPSRRGGPTFLRHRTADPGFHARGCTKRTRHHFQRLNRSRATAKSSSQSETGDAHLAERAWLQLQWHGDADKAQAVLDEAGRTAGHSDDAGYIAEVQQRIALARRDYPGALSKLEAETRAAIDNQDGYWPIPLLRGQVHRLAGQSDLARRSFEAARLTLEQKAMQAPEDHRICSSLGIACAGLGRRGETVREARLACDLMPASKDALIAIMPLWQPAVVYTMVGRPAEAITTLDDLLSRSGWWTPHALRLDPTWNPLRSDPRFQALLTKYEVKP